MGQNLQQVFFGRAGDKTRGLALEEQKDRCSILASLEWLGCLQECLLELWRAEGIKPGILEGRLGGEDLCSWLQKGKERKGGLCR